MATATHPTRLRPARNPEPPAPGGGFRIGRVFGIEIRLDYSWLVIALLVTFSLGGELATRFAGLPAVAVAAGALVTGLLFFGSILAHELSHSLVARARGAEVEGITLFVFGGISQLKGEPAKPRDEFLIAIVGPVSSLVLGGIFLAASRLLPTDTPGAWASRWLGVTNVMLAAFNLLPGYPLDGGRLLRAGVWAVTRSLRKATRVAARSGMVLGGLLIAFGMYLAFVAAVFGPGVWIGLIGWFLLSAARGSLVGQELRELLGRYRVRQLMRTDCPHVDVAEDVRTLVDHYVLGTGERCLFVTEDSNLRGLITLHEIKALPRERWAAATAGDVMIPIERLRSLSPSDSLARALEEMDTGRVHQLPVIEQGRLVGMISREDVLRVLAANLELGSA